MPSSITRRQRFVLAEQPGAARRCQRDPGHRHQQPARRQRAHRSCGWPLGRQQQRRHCSVWLLRHRLQVRVAPPRYRIPRNVIARGERGEGHPGAYHEPIQHALLRPRLPIRRASAGGLGNRASRHVADVVEVFGSRAGVGGAASVAHGARDGLVYVATMVSRAVRGLRLHASRARRQMAGWLALASTRPTPRYASA